MNDALNENLIRGMLPPQLAVDVTVLPSVPSTNRFAREHLRIDQPSIVVAEQQTAGVGRFHNHFVSPAHAGVYLTLIWPLARTVVGGLEAARSALAVTEAVASVTGLRLGIKWPNDLVSQHHKCGGILIEQVVTTKAHYLIVGIGLNLAALDTAILPGSLTLADTPKKDWTRNALVAAMTRNFASLINQPAQRWLSTYTARLVWVGSEIRFRVNGQTEAGRMVGVDALGRLLVTNETGDVTAFEAERIGGIRPVDQSYNKIGGFRE